MACKLDMHNILHECINKNNNSNNNIIINNNNNNNSLFAINHRQETKKN